MRVLLHLAAGKSAETPHFVGRGGPNGGAHTAHCAIVSSRPRRFLNGARAAGHRLKGSGRQTLTSPGQKPRWTPRTIISKSTCPYGQHLELLSQQDGFPGWASTAPTRRPRPSVSGKMHTFLYLVLHLWKLKQFSALLVDLIHCFRLESSSHHLADTLRNLHSVLLFPVVHNKTLFYVKHSIQINMGSEYRKFIFNMIFNNISDQRQHLTFPHLPSDAFSFTYCK